MYPKLLNFDSLGLSTFSVDNPVFNTSHAPSIASGIKGFVKKRTNWSICLNTLPYYRPFVFFDHQLKRVFVSLSLSSMAALERNTHTAFIHKIPYPAIFHVEA
ncbi:MAG: hypothetical protein QX198_14730 [Methylococcaceae bacterium]